MTETETSQAPGKTCLLCQKEFFGDITTCPDDGTSLAQLSGDDLIGKLFVERYQILEPIGGGGMGRVYKARHVLMNRLVAIKVLRRDVIATSETLKRFRVEAQAASALSLPNILAVYDFGISAEGQAYLVMDYLDGRGLNDILETEGKLSVERALPIFIQICQGLAHAHAKGIIHRDIKPGNIMIVNWEGQSDFVKIVDFGIAKVLNEDSDSINLTRTGEVFGSPLYMSPEQWKGHKLDHRTDIYSLGCIMYRALTGKPVFQTENAFDAMYKQVHEIPVPLCALCPEIPGELEHIVMKAIAKDPANRYQSMTDLAVSLEHLQAAISRDDVTAPNAVQKGAISAGTPGGAANSPAVVSHSPALAPIVPGVTVKRPAVAPPAPVTDANGSSSPTAVPQSLTVTVSVPSEQTGYQTAVPPALIPDLNPDLNPDLIPDVIPDLIAPKKEDTIHLIIPKPSPARIAVVVGVVCTAMIGGGWAAFHHGSSLGPELTAPPPAPPLPAGINGANPAAIDDGVRTKNIQSIAPAEAVTGASPHLDAPPNPLPRTNQGFDPQGQTFNQSSNQSVNSNQSGQLNQAGRLAQPPSFEKKSESKTEHASKHHGDKRAGSAHEKHGIVGKLKKFFGKL